MRENPHVDLAAVWRVPATLTGPEYCSPKIFELERQRIFHAGWFCVGRDEEVPTGKPLVVELAGEAVSPAAVDTVGGVRLGQPRLRPSAAA